MKLCLKCGINPRRDCCKTTKLCHPCYNEQQTEQSSSGTWEQWKREQWKLQAKTAKRRKQNKKAYDKHKRRNVFYRKTCSKCKQILSGARFYSDERANDGLYSCCKKCHRNRLHIPD